MGKLLNHERATGRKREHAPLAPAPERGRRPGAHTLSPSLARVATRALAVDPEELRSYQPSELDVYIAEALLTGSTTYKEIAADITAACGETVSAPVVGRRLRDPLACAWACRAVHNAIHHRLGMIDAAMVRRAMAGDVRAADLIYKRYGKMASINISVNAQAGEIDLTKLSDEQLSRLAAHEGRRVIDVPAPKTEESKE